MPPRFSVDDDNDNDLDDIPMQERVANDPDGEDPTSLVQEKNSLQDASDALLIATQKLEVFLNKNVPLPAPAVRADQVVAPGGNIYDRASALLAARESVVQFQLLPADVERLADNDVKTAVRNAVAESNKLRNAAKAVLNDPKQLAGMRMKAMEAATDAEKFADDAERAAQNASPEGKDAAIRVRELAQAMRAEANALNARFTEQDRIQSVLKDAKRRTIIIGVVVGSTIAIVVTGAVVGLLYYFHVLGGGQVPLPVGPTDSSDAGMDLKDLDVDGLDDGKAVVVDVAAFIMAQNPSFVPSMIASIVLSDASGSGAPAPAAWVASGTKVIYTPTAKPTQGSTAIVKYAVNYADSSVPQSAFQSLTITFVDKAVDIAQAPTSSASTVTFGSLPNNLTATAQPGWALSGNIVTYTTPTPAPVAASLPYSLGLLADNTQNAAQLVILFPPSAVTVSSAADLSMPTSSPALPAIPADVANVAWTLLDANSKPTNSIDATVGTWTLSSQTPVSIVFTPSATTPPTPGSLLTVNFGLKLTDGTTLIATSAAATASLTFAIGTVTYPPATDLTFIAPDNTGSIASTGVWTFPLPSGLSNVTVTPNVSTDGTWSLNNNSLQFTPGTTFSTQKPASYTASNLSGKANIILILPVDIVQTGVLRDSSQTINVAGGSMSANSNFPASPTVISVSVTQTTPATPTTGAWENAGSIGYVTFTPNPSPIVQAVSAIYSYVVTFSDNSTTTANLTLDFDTTFKAYDYTINVKSSQLTPSIPFDVKDHIYFPGGVTFNSLTLGAQIPAGSSASNVWGASGSTITLTATAPYISQYVIHYTVSDQNGNTVSASITVNQSVGVMPMAADFLLSKDVWTPANLGTVKSMAGMDVLKNCRAFHGKDPASVRLLGPVDLGADYAAPAAFGIIGTSLEGKQLRIPGEGCWLVTDDGKVGFVAEAGLTAPPTPVAYCFRDMKGNQSDPAVMIIDHVLDDVMTTIPNAYGAMSDKDFWDYFQKNVIWWTTKPMMSNEEFVATCALLAGMTHSLGMVGRYPISSEELRAAYDTWFAAGKKWHEDSGKTDPGRIFSIAQDLVDNAITSTTLPYRKRYWRLSLMAQLASYSPILPLIKH